MQPQLSWLHHGPQVEHVHADLLGSVTCKKCLQEAFYDGHESFRLRLLNASKNLIQVMCTVDVTMGGLYLKAERNGTEI